MVIRASETTLPKSTIIPTGRLMKMRWVLVLKAVEGRQDVAKCKARIVTPSGLL